MNIQKRTVKNREKQNRIYLGLIVALVLSCLLLPCGLAGTATATPAYPLKVSTNNRYLVDQNNAPFLIVGDSPQALFVNLSEADADFFLANRQAAGFNTVWVNLLCATYTGGRADGSTYDGIVPFTTLGDLSTPNETYFSRVDNMIRLAADHGLVVFLIPAETGSWLSVLRTNGLAKARNYGRYLGNRYKNFDNIVWMSGNDFQTWGNPTDDALVQAVALGIKDNDTRHIHTVELNYLVSGSLDDSTWAPIIQLGASYTYYPTYAQVLTDYNRSNYIPTFMVEANYEFENNNGLDYGSPNILRRQEYWTMLSGAAGQLYGNHYTWQFLSAWKSNLDTPGSNQLGYMKALFEPRPWYNLVPDQNHAVVTAGYGTYSATGAVNTNNYLTAARTSDGALVIAYMPTNRTITVDMSKLSGVATARWYDPSNGTYTTITGSPFANTGTRQFTPPGNNSDGDGDWVLVLETQVDSSEYLNLSAGWNFVSFPALPANKGVEQVLPTSILNHVMIVWAWDGSTQLWKRWRPAGGATNTLTLFEFGKGYWIYTDVAGAVDLSGWLPPGSTIVHVYPGWNLVGYVGTDGSPIATELNGIFGYWSIIWNWSGGQWCAKAASITLPPSIQTISLLNQKKAYWIKIRQGTEMDWIQ